MLGAVDRRHYGETEYRRRQVVVSWRDEEHPDAVIMESLCLTLNDELADKPLVENMFYVFDVHCYVDMFNGRMFNKFNVKSIETPQP